MNASELRRVLAAATKLLGKRRSPSILNTCVLREDTLHATNCETSFIVKLPGVQCDTPVCVDPRTLGELLPKGSGPVTLTTGSQACFVHGTVISCPLPVDEYPNIPDTDLMAPASDTVMLPSKGDCQWVLMAAFPEESRLNIQGAYVDLDHGKVVATDGHRLHACTADTCRLLPDFVRAVIPTVAFHALFSLGGDQRATCQYYVDNTVQYAVLRTELVTIIARLEDAPFPDYCRDFPSVITRITVPMQPLVDALKTCLPLHPHASLTPRDGGLTVSVPGKFDPFVVRTGHLLDILSGFEGETCTLAVPADVRRATEWTSLGGTRQALLMPLRKN